MTKFREYKGLDLPALAEEVLTFWKEHRVFERSVEEREGNPAYIFFEGPPSANGKPGIHHVMSRTIKDTFPRYKTMKGYQVKRKAGWDTHGLPVEIGVEKELGITKEDIGKSISIEDYNQACRDAVMRYTDIWNDLTEKMGYWVDMDDPYVTFHSKYMESVWWLLAEIYNKGWLYKGYTIQPYSPKAGTGLSSHELNMPGTYQDVTDTTVTAQFELRKDTAPQFIRELEGEVFILAWTTTPWTLPSNTALTVGREIDYVWVRTYNIYTFEPITVILARDLVGKQFDRKFYEVKEAAELQAYEKGAKKTPYWIGGGCKGSDLVGSRYHQLIDKVQPYEYPENAFRVIAGDFVTTEDGTGVVHTAPTFGADDARVALEAEPPIPPMRIKDEHGALVPLVDLQGRFRPELGEWGNKFVKNEYYPDGEAPERSIDVEIAIHLKEQNRAFKVEKYVHSYPNCWRTDKPILYYPLDSWFIKVTEVRDRMVELNQTINWKPRSTGEGRFGNWLASANDWNLSRSRYWGIPLPIWRTEDKTEVKVIASVAELKQAIDDSIEKGYMAINPFAEFVDGDMSEENYQRVDLHKNVVDRVVLVSESGRPMHRESDLIDVWFDSGSMPYAQWHYPFENKELIEENKAFPADFIAEGVDQTRGWFYTLHAISTMVFDQVAYRNVLSNGLVLDKEGKKMSKRLGNAVDPFETLKNFGPDATRWYLMSNANPWDNIKFDLEGISEVKNKFFGTLYNTYAFFALYANIDGFTHEEPEVPLSERTEMDRWILSELHSLIELVDGAYKDYDATRATRAISDFVQDYLSNWYVRLGRRRFWKGEYGSDKVAAYQTLHECLMVVAKLAAPVAPFYAEHLYRDLNQVTGRDAEDSVHLTPFPVSRTEWIDRELENRIETAQKIASLVFSIRQKEKIKVRQPLQRMLIPVLNEERRRQIESVRHLILPEVNVKELEFMDDTSGILVKSIKPNFKVLGPKYGRDMKEIGLKVAGFDQQDIIEIEQNGEIEIELENKSVKLMLTDVEITSQDVDGWNVANSADITVALDTTVTEDLKKEGIARELVNRIQNLRKESGYNVTDRIVLKFQRDPWLNRAVQSNTDYIKQETLADELSLEDALREGVEISFDDVTTKMWIEKV